MTEFVKHGVWIFILISLVFSGCSDSLRSNADGNGVNVVPNTFEKLDDTENPDDDSNLDPSQQDQNSDETTSKPQPPPKITEGKNGLPRKVSTLMYYAQKIMETEGRKIGTACNFYVHRVLQAAGFPYKIFLANDFDLYAKQYFKKYKAEDFSADSNAEIKRLEKYIWAYPERTPFITQWSRTGRHGHIALVERIGDKMVIYQASLGTKTARKDQTSPEILLKGYNRRQLTVYSEMTPK